MPPRYSYFNRLMALIVILFGLTGGIFLNLRTFSMFATIMYGGIVNRDSDPIEALS